MNATFTNKYRPLEIVNGAMCAIWTIWCLVLTILFFDATRPFFSNYMEMEGTMADVFRALMKVFTYAAHIFNPLLLLWFILKRKELRKGVATLAIVGLTIMIILDVINIIVGYVYPLDAQRASSNSWMIYSTMFSIIDWIALLLIGIAFVNMSRQFDKKVGVWAIIAGVMCFLAVAMYIVSLLNSYVFIHLYPIEHYSKVNQIVNIVQEFFVTIKHFAMCMFFFAKKTS